MIGRLVQGSGARSGSRHVAWLVTNNL